MAGPFLIPPQILLPNSAQEFKMLHKQQTARASVGFGLVEAGTHDGRATNNQQSTTNNQQSTTNNEREKHESRFASRPLIATRPDLKFARPSAPSDPAGRD
jgi:hypothetical protein